MGARRMAEEAAMQRTDLSCAPWHETNPRPAEVPQRLRRLVVAGLPERPRQGRQPCRLGEAFAADVPQLSNPQ